MAKPTGFMEYARETPGDRSPEVRVKDWHEFHGHFLSEDLRKRQAARCMDCGTPYCHSGIVYSGAVSGCPLGNLVPEWNDLVWKGRWLEAWRRLKLTNNFPEFTGRVCPAPCEGACTLGLISDPVTIKLNEVEIADRAWAEGHAVPEPPKSRTGKKVAVIGSGPSGLACADQLNRQGHEVTVYERADRPGGLLMYGIPNMKLDKTTVLKRIDLMKAEGVLFRTGVAVVPASGESGSSIAGQELLACHDAVVLASGASKPRDIKVPGRELAGVHFAMEFLGKSTKSLLDSGQRDGEFIQSWGKRVVIIGGGDTGTDCVGTALRQGARSVVQLEILPRPPLVRGADSPWPRWPRVLKTDYGQEEAVFLQGEDPRQFCVTVTGFRGSGGVVTGVATVQVEWKKDGSGRMQPIPVPGSEKEIDADLVFIAAGFLGPEDAVLEAFGLSRDSRGLPPVKGFASPVSGLFVAGDARRGQSLVVWAIDEGRRAAREVDAFLMGT